MFLKCVSSFSLSNTAAVFFRTLNRGLCRVNDKYLVAQGMGSHFFLSRQLKFFALAQYVLHFLNSPANARLTHTVIGSDMKHGAILAPIHQGHQHLIFHSVLGRPSPGRMGIIFFFFSLHFLNHGMEGGKFYACSSFEVSRF